MCHVKDYPSSNNNITSAVYDNYGFHENILKCLVDLICILLVIPLAISLDTPSKLFCFVGYFNIIEHDETLFNEEFVRNLVQALAQNIIGLTAWQSSWAKRLDQHKLSFFCSSTTKKT